MADPNKVIRERSLPTTSLIYPLDLNRPGRQNYLEFKLNFNYADRYLSRETETITICLYLPRGVLKTSYKQNYSEFQGGQIFKEVGGAAVDAYTQSFGSPNQTSFMENTKRFAEEFGKNFGSSSDTAAGRALQNVLGPIAPAAETFASGTARPGLGMMAGAIAGAPLLGFLGQGGITDAISATIDVAINPHTSIIYKGPRSFRQHKFSFDFFPRSSKEANEVNDIVNRFKTMMLPKKTDGVNFASTFLKAPGTIDTKIYINSTEFTRFNFRRSVIEDLDINYESEGGPSFFADGNPTKTSITFTTREIEFIYGNETIENQEDDTETEEALATAP